MGNVNIYIYICEDFEYESIIIFRLFIENYFWLIQNRLCVLQIMFLLLKGAFERHDLNLN